MTIHREGNITLIITAVVLAVINGIVYAIIPSFLGLSILLSVVFFIFILSFFRDPGRKLESIDDTVFISPCDGKVVVIEETEESEYFKDKRLQVSIFMSPLNVHINWHAISGSIAYYKYHPGKYLAAWNPKSSTENERTTTVYDYGEDKLLVRQIAGALARRIVCYAQKRQVVKQGDELGFIKFGSRVDLYFPIGTEILVKMDEKVSGNKTIIAKR